MGKLRTKSDLSLSKLLLETLTFININMLNKNKYYENSFVKSLKSRVKFGLIN